LVAFVASAVYIRRSEQQLAVWRADGRAFDLHAREIAASLSDMRSAQQAYVAVGQGAAFWMPKVEETTNTIRTSVTTLRADATSAGAQFAIEQAADALGDFSQVDDRARDYLRTGQLLMAGDVIFTEGDQTAAAAARNIEAARLAEHQALDALEASVRRRQAIMLAGAGSLAAFMVLLLGITGATKSDLEDPVATASALSITERPDVPSRPAASEVQPPQPRAGSPVLKIAAQLCTDFASIRDVNDLQMLLGRASDIMDAGGIVVWLGNPDGSMLLPVLAHGYSDAIRARLPNVPRSANNAAAAAYRSGHVQIVLSRPGGAKGAVIAPIMGAQGCIGALSAEIRSGGEASESVQALASIVAAQLAGVLSFTEPEASAPRAAASSRFS
jgi:hypothetical protein